MYTIKVVKDKKGQFRVQFCHKKEIMFWTESYTRKPSAIKAIESLKNNIATAEIVEVDEVAEALAAKAAAKAKAAKAKAPKAKAKK